MAEEDRGCPLCQVLYTLTYKAHPQTATSRIVLFVLET